MKRVRNKSEQSLFLPGLSSWVCAFLLLISAPVFSQTWTMPVDGRVFAADEKLSGAIVTLYRNGLQLQQVVTTSNGKFSFELPANAEYVIAITKPGYITKKFKIITANVPADRADAGPFNPFGPDVTLFEMPTAPEIAKRVEAILSQPIGVYQYMPAEKDFNYDEKYTQAMQDKLAELAQLQKQVEKEMQEKAKNAAMEAQKQLEIDKKYKAAIAKGDGAMTTKDYNTAKSAYTEAQIVKPTEPYPKQKLAEIDKLLADAGKQKEIDAKYQEAIKKGDGAFGSKDYASAKTAYTEASGIKPAEAYPKTKLAEIDKLLADQNKQKELDAKYQAAITKGDGAFNSKDYASAKTAYTEATGIKPAEAYPKGKLSEIEKLLAEAGKQKEIDAKYQAAITKGDGAFNSKDYASAKTAYTEASGIKPAEAYPKTKLAEIDKLLAEAGKQKELDAKYQAAITKADNAFNSKDYNAAKSSYAEASGIKPAEAYPKKRLAEIDKLLADVDAQNILDVKYKAAIAQGDAALVSKDYTSAQKAYTDAWRVKPTETYPKTKLAEIDKILANAEADKQKEVDYKNAIAKGDGALAAKDYALAKSGYQEALGIKPAEAYPKTKIAEIDKILADMAKAGDLEKQYKDLIAKADNSFTAKDYTSARTSYSSASALKGSEQYPKTKIAEIDKILADAGKQKELDAKYQAAISKGDGAFAAKDYGAAKRGYLEASELKPMEAYPKTKIAEIDKILAEAGKQKDLDAQYQAAIKKGDGSFTAKDYASAKTSYEDALGIKPSEAYPKNKIAEIDKILADQAKSQSAAEKEKQYKDAVARGDKAFTAKEYDDAKSAYNEALGVKPAEAYPKNKIAEIDKLLAASGKEKELDAKYQAAIKKGDNAFFTKDYTAAKAGYTEASGLKPAEEYPKNKIAEIDKLLSDAANAGAQKETDAKYQATIAKGDKSFGMKDYITAKAMYKEASRIKPTEQYPKDKLAEIDKIEKDAIAAKEQAEINKQYAAAIARADKSFSAKDYNSAKLAYEDALTYKAEEKYPQDQIKKIADILKPKPVKTKQTTTTASKEPVVSEEEKIKQYQDEIRAKYPMGVTEEEYEKDGKTILRRVVVRQDFAGIYTRVTHNWGGVYCFRDNTPITEIVFDNETK